MRLADRYRDDAEKCLQSGADLAGLVSVRAALETVLIARFLLELFEWSDTELKEHDICVEKGQELIEIPPLPVLKTLIEEAYKAELITKTGYYAAHRIREWGNRIHPERVADQQSLPKIGPRNLNARLRDLDLVIDQLLNTL